MNELLPAWPSLSAFLIASLVLAVTPGPGVIFIVARSLLQGRGFGLASVAGVALGNLGNAIGASLGLAALFAMSSVAFLVVKYAGALYLVYLGIRALRALPAELIAPPPGPARLGQVFRDGFIVALLNPKTVVFFAAFLPQFMRADSAPMLQSLTLGSMFVAIAAVTDSAYALAAGAIAPGLAGLRSFRALGRYLTGGIFIGIGIFTALLGPRSGN